MVFKCKMCGGDVEVLENNIGKCLYCKSTMTLPNIENEKIINLYNRANFLRISNDFDKAKEIYENILEIDNNQIEAHWGILLCKYGVEYVDDPNTKKKIPTCHRTLDTSILTDKDFKIIKKESFGDTLDLYNKEALAIDKIQKDILSVSIKEKPYDVFICYKETDENNERTVDSVIAQDIYDKLIDNGLKVFFARITLENKLGTEYEPYIYSALKSSKVMLVVGTTEENFNAVWVKNEWSRYLEMMKDDKGKALIPVYSKINPYKLPEEFAMLQAQSMDKIGALQDVVRGVKKLVDEYSGNIKDYEQETIDRVASALDDARSIGNGKYEVTIVKENLPLWYYITVILIAGFTCMYYLSFLMTRLTFLHSVYTSKLFSISKVAFVINFISYIFYGLGLLFSILNRKLIKYKKPSLLVFVSLYLISYFICIGKGYIPSISFVIPLLPVLPLYLFNPSFKLNTSAKTIMDKDEKDKQIGKNKLIKNNFTVKEKYRINFKLFIFIVSITFLCFGISLYKILPYFSSSNIVDDNLDYLDIYITKYIYRSPGSSVFVGYINSGDKFEILDIENINGYDYVKIKTNKLVTGWINLSNSSFTLNFKNYNIIDEEDKDVEIIVNCNVQGGMCEKYYLQSNERDYTKKQLKVITDYINIRKEASPSSSKLGRVHKGDIYTILDEFYNWYKIKTSKGKTGWISKGTNNEVYVELLDYSE